MIPYNEMRAYLNLQIYAIASTIDVYGAGFVRESLSDKLGIGYFAENEIEQLDSIKSGTIETELDSLKAFADINYYFAHAPSIYELKGRKGEFSLSYQMHFVEQKSKIFTPVFETEKFPLDSLLTYFANLEEIGRLKRNERDAKATRLLLDTQIIPNYQPIITSLIRTGMAIGGLK